MRTVAKEFARLLGVIALSIVITFVAIVVIAYLGGFQVIAEVARR